jgi:hypothetical protein
MALMIFEMTHSTSSLKFAPFSKETYTVQDKHTQNPEAPQAQDSEG